MADDEDTTSSTRPHSPKLYYIKEARAKSVPQQLTGSVDLMATYNLLPEYDKYVKQKLDDSTDAPPIEPTYFSFISDLPGKNVIRPGNYIRSLMEAPDKSYGSIHAFVPSTLRDGFSLRPGPVPGFDSSVLGTDEDPAYKQTQKIGAIAPIAGDGHAAMTGQRLSGNAMLDPNELSSQSTHSHHHHHHHGHHGSKSMTSSPHVDRTERGEDGNREHRHKKKKKKRKHEHDHEHGHHEGEGDSEHRKKKKRKREREEHGDIDIV